MPSRKLRKPLRVTTDEEVEVWAEEAAVEALPEKGDDDDDDEDEEEEEEEEE